METLALRLRASTFKGLGSLAMRMAPCGVTNPSVSSIVFVRMDLWDQMGLSLSRRLILFPSVDEKLGEEEGSPREKMMQWQCAEVHWSDDAANHTNQAGHFSLPWDTCLLDGEATQLCAIFLHLRPLKPFFGRMMFL